MSRYVAKDDAEHINAPASRPLRDFTLLFVAALIVLALLAAGLGWCGETILLQTSAETETSLLRRVMQPKTRHLQKVPELAELFQSYGAGTGFPLEFDVDCSNNPNAYSVPGGLVMVTTGLLRQMHSINGLAFVVEHEIGHFVHRDHLRGFGRNMALLLAAGYLGFDMTDYILGETVATAVDRTHTRAQEEAADAYALAALMKLYGHVWGADEFFNAFAGSADAQLPTFFRTHPADEDRRAHIRSQLKGTDAKLQTPKLPFVLMARNACS